MPISAIATTSTTLVLTATWKNSAMPTMLETRPARLATTKSAAANSAASTVPLACRQIIAAGEILQVGHPSDVARIVRVDAAHQQDRLSTVRRSMLDMDGAGAHRDLQILDLPGRRETAHGTHDAIRLQALPEHLHPDIEREGQDSLRMCSRRRLAS